MTIEISLSNIRMGFGEKIVLDNLDLSLLKNDIHTIIGTTGSGKSLILKIIAKMVLPQSGNLETMNEKTAFVFQDNPFLNWLSIEKNLALSTGRDLAIYSAWLKRFRLEEYLNLFPKQLSGGTRQKFNLLRAFAHHSDVLLLDEPFSHLDQLQKEDLYNFTIELWKEKRPTIILVTHDIDEAIYLSHRISFLSKKDKKIAASILVKKKEDPHSNSFIEEKNKSNYLDIFNQIYSLYKKDDN